MEMQDCFTRNGLTATARRLFLREP